MALRPLEEVGEDLARWATSDIPRVPTGYSFFDSRTNGGVATGEVLMMLARTTVGKTWFAVNMAVNNPNVPSIFLSLEMHGRYILSRLAAVHTDVSTTLIEQTLATKGSARAIDRTVKDYPLLQIEDHPGITIADMVKRCDLYEERMGLRPVCVYIDYVELIRAFGMSQQENVDKLTWRIKDFAREADVAVVALHQVKRGESKKDKDSDSWFSNEGHKPVRLTDGRFGGEMASDYTMGMYRPSLNPNLSETESAMMAHDMRLQFLKTRGGSDIHPWGAQHYYEPRTGKISEVQW